MSDEKQNNLLGEIKRLLDAPPKSFDYGKAREILDDLKEAGLEPGTLVKVSRKINDAQYRHLLHKVEGILNEKLDEEKIQQAVNLLDDAHNLTGDKTEIQQFRVRLDEISNHFRAMKKFEETKQACESLWAQEQDAIRQKTTPDKILNDIFYSAQSIAKEVAEKFPKSLALDGLKNDAVMRYQMARIRYEIKTTADREHDYRAALEKLDKIEDKETLIPWNDIRGDQLEPIPVRQAILEIEVQSRSYANDKAKEYLYLAKTELEDKHAPRLAREQIEKRKDLWGLHPQDKINIELQKYLDEKIQPEIEKLEKADSLVEQSRKIDNLLQGWTLLDEALKTYAWIPVFDDAREQLIERMLHQAETKLEEAEQAYAAFQSKLNNSALGEAQARTSDARGLLERVKDYAKAGVLSQKALELSQKISSAQKFIEEVESKTTSLENLFAQKPAQVQSDLEDLLMNYSNPQYAQKYGDLLARFPRLQTLQARVQAFQDFENSLQELDETFIDSDLEQIASTLEKAHSILGDMKDKSRRERVNALIKKFQGRQEFLTGQQVLADTGDMGEALKHLRKVAGYANHPDQQATQELLKRLEGEHATEQKISDALKNADDLLKTQPKRAYEILEKVAGIPTQQKTQVKASLERAREQWEQQLLTRLDALLGAKSTDPSAIRKLSEEISTLPEPRSEESDQKARNALARAFALEAKIHAEAGRWENAEISWKAARDKDFFNTEYKQGWREARLRRAKTQLARAKGEQEIQGVLADLQNELVDDPEVFELQAEHIYRLSQNLGLNAEARLEHLAQAQSNIKVAASVPNISQTLKGRLDDLNGQVSADEELLKTQMDIEKRMSPDASLSQLSSTVQDVQKLLDAENSSSVARNGLQSWWKESVVPGVVSDLENIDDGLMDGQLWERFEVRSKIALLSPENPRARELVRAVPRQVEDLLDEVAVVVSDYSGLTLEGRDSVQVLVTQQKRVFDLRDRSQVLFEMVDRLSRELGGQSSRLKTEIQAARVKIETWMREFDSFRLNVLHLRDFLSQARQDDDWSDFDDILNEKINPQGFGAHRVVRLILEERDRVVEKRRDLKTLQDKIVNAAQDPQGLRFTQAINLLDILEKDDKQGDPYDNFGFQTELQISDPLNGKTIRQAAYVRAWLVERQKQLDFVLSWLAECGLKDLVPATVLMPANLSTTKKLLNWEDVRGKLAQALEQGKFEEISIALDAVLRDGKQDDEIHSKSSARRNASHIEKMLESYEGFIRMEDARNKISQPPFSAEAGLSRLIVTLLQQAVDRLKSLDKNIQEVNEMRRGVEKKQRDWKDAELELEQALSELNNAKGKLNPFGKEKLIQSARTRAEKAKIVCKEIAPHHPVLENIDSLLM